MQFKNKKILIIGATSGIGLATAKKYHQTGAQLFLLGKNEKKLKKIQEELNDTTIKYFLGDITNVKNLYDVFEKMQKENITLDFLVVTAGIGKFGSYKDISEEEYDLVMNTNAKGTYFSVKFFSELLINGGAIVLTSSFLARKYIPYTSVLSASKVAVETFTKIFARELSSTQIRVNAVSPGSIKTNFMAVANPNEETKVELRNNMPEIPIGKRGEANEVAEAILFLTSENAKYINGTVLAIDGGLSIA